MKSPSAPGNVWQDGMNAKNRGWSARFMYGSTSRSQPLEHGAERPAARRAAGPPIRAAISAGVARRSAGIVGSLSRSTSRSTAW